MKVPKIAVGIQESKELSFTLGACYFTEDIEQVTGTWKAIPFGDRILIYNDEGEEYTCASETLFEPYEGEDQASFTLHGVTIGIDFHWERDEALKFQGCLKLQRSQEQLLAINILSLEDYLLSVISSEMNANASLEFLKAHAVVSRSWLLAQITKKEQRDAYASVYESRDEYIRWYDREDHHDFDVCADDHCQRYQGITRITNQQVIKAVQATQGEVLRYDTKICDARFSKCCGGITELFENTWEGVNHPYLESFVDGSGGESMPNLRDEKMMSEWLDKRPDVFCNNQEPQVLSQVLNDYDLETADFFRWRESYSQDEISCLIRERSGRDLGVIEDLIPLERGPSGRLVKLKILGSKQTLTVGKELEIRKLLSKSHLYSSAFIVVKKELEGEVFFDLIGAGWGHGVGLCQIGAAVMGAKAYSYDEILKHYYRGASLDKLY